MNKSRRQTRRLRLDRPFGNWPVQHNDSVAIRKAYKRVSRQWAVVNREWRKAQIAIAAANRSFTALVDAVNQEGTK